MWTATRPFALLTLLISCAEVDEKPDSGGGAATDSGIADACGPAEVPGETPLGLAGDASCGADVWAAHCAGCHGAEALGGSGGPGLDEHVPAHTDEELVFVIVAGTGDMPSLGLGNQEVAHSLAWLRDRFGPYDGVGH